jgi:tetratricopeptide (TPR) repeat protein
VKKNYDAKSKSYNTTYDAINVSCATCHGEAKQHIEWTKDTTKNIPNHGFTVDLSAFQKDRWKIDTKTGKPKLQGEIDRSEVERCAPCHSRRTQIKDGYKAGESFSDYYLMNVIREPLYYSDGKMKDEVFVYGSFKQSKMYHAGVSCSDCHDPHSLERKAVDDNVCNKCHRRSDYDTPKHHKHKRASASCIDCHMNHTTYMGVDKRNDHSFRVPRPDLSELTDSPNACKSCHSEKSNKQLASAMKRWYGKTPKGYQNFGEALHYLTINDKRAYESMYEAFKAGQSDIIKASLTSYLGNYPSQQTYMTTMQMLRSSAPEVMVAAIQSLEKFGMQRAVKHLFGMLEDETLVVRLEAMRILSALPSGGLDAAQKKLYEKVLQEYKQSLLFNADRAETQLTLATFYVNQKNYTKAEEAYKEAIRLQEWYVPAYVNYAEFARHIYNETQAHAIIQLGLKANPHSAELYHVLGLWQIRNAQKITALMSLQKAYELQSDNARYAYVYGVALADTNKQEAIRVLEKTLAKHSGDRNIAAALEYYKKQN